MNRLFFILLLYGFNVQANQENINVELLDEIVTQVSEKFMEEEGFFGPQAAVLYKKTHFK